MSVLLPWPLRHQRRQAISDARREKERSQSGARHAAVIEQDIQRMRRDNHFSELIAGHIMRGHSHGGGQ
jgi:hypothetical protein